jgi:hypothetical protein
MLMMVRYWSADLPASHWINGAPFMTFDSHEGSGPETCSTSEFDRFWGHRRFWAATS